MQIAARQTRTVSTCRSMSFTLRSINNNRLCLLLLSLFVLGGFNDACGQSQVTSVETLTPPPPSRRKCRAGRAAPVQNGAEPPHRALTPGHLKVELTELTVRA